MKILMTTDNLGGVWTYSLELAAALAEWDIHIELAVMGSPVSPEQHRQAERLPNVRLHGRACKLEWMDQPWDDVDEAGQWLLELEESTGCDVVHLNGYSHASLPWRSAVLVVGHSCVLSWWQAVKGEPAPSQWDAYRSRVHQGLHAADWIVAPTSAMLEMLNRNYGPLGRAGVIANCRRGEGLWSCGSKQPIVLSAGRLWDEGKNIRGVEALASKIRSRIFIAGGDGPGPDRVEYLGWLAPEQLAQWFALASIFVHPAKYEPFGLAPLEAALSGCALVLGDIESLREVWGDCALYAPCDSPAALTEQVRLLESDDLLRRHMAAKAQLRAQRYRPDKAAMLYERLYRRIDREKRAKSGTLRRRSSAPAPRSSARADTFSPPETAWLDQWPDIAKGA